MKNEHFAERLREERGRLGFSQQQVADMLSMTQSAYSRIESGATKPSANRLQEIATILEANGFINLPPVQLERTGDKLAIYIRWPWHRYSLYAILVVLAILIFDYIIHIPEDISRGISSGTSGEPGQSVTTTIFILLVIGSSVVYGLYRSIKWLVLKKY